MYSFPNLFLSPGFEVLCLMFPDNCLNVFKRLTEPVFLWNWFVVATAEPLSPFRPCCVLSLPPAAGKGELQGCKCFCEHVGYRSSGVI